MAAVTVVIVTPCMLVLAGMVPEPESEMA